MEEVVCCTSGEDDEGADGPVPHKLGRRDKRERGGKERLKNDAGKEEDEGAEEQGRLGEPTKNKRERLLSLRFLDLCVRGKQPPLLEAAFSFSFFTFLHGFLFLFFF